MDYQFSFYQESDFAELEEMVLNSYEWEDPAACISRIEFAKGLHPKFTGYPSAWEHTVGMYRQAGKLVACVWNEGTYEGDLFFLFDSKKRAQDLELLKEMIRFAKRYCVTFEGQNRRSLQVFIPKWNHTLVKLAEDVGLKKADWAERSLVWTFDEKRFDVHLPEGYTIIDGRQTPAFYLSNAHRMAFGYGKDSYACAHGAEAFADLRKLPHYDKNLELCMLDAMGHPVAIAILWYDIKLTYCELEPLGVVWWERRKGLGTAILQEAANRVRANYPQCKGMMLGGDQQFYRSIGFELKNEVYAYRWEKDIYISWDEKSIDQDYASEMFW